jgi:cobalt-zinc-cadmium efflux system outer membrane protein
MRPKFAIVVVLSILAGLAAVAPLAHGQGAASDTLRLTLKETETQFLKNNLTLISQKYNIDIANAQIITARLFPNTDFSFSNGILNDTHDAYRNQSISVSQLFYTAGKRNKNIQLAKISAEQAKYQFFDIIRTLKYTLRTDFYSIYYQQQSAKVYDQEIASLQKTFTVFKEQYAKGNIAQKELLRIQSQLYSLQSEYNSLLTGIDSTQSELKILIKATPANYVVPVVDSNAISKEKVAAVPYRSLLDSANTNRYDLKNARAAVDYNNMNLQLQKATAIPDVSFSLGYDKFGSFNNNYLGGGIEFNLPFFNRNQGGIKQARIAIDQSKVQLQSQQQQVEMDLANTYKTALRIDQLYSSFDPQFKQDFTHLIGEVFKNYQKHNISMLEFLDFYDSFKTNTIQINTLQLNRVSALEQLNFVTGTPFFNQ